MATIKAIVRTTRKGVEVPIRFRLSDGREIQLFHTSDIMVRLEDWDSKTQTIKARVVYKESKRVEINSAINERKAIIAELYNKESHKESLTSEWLETAIDKVLHPDKYTIKKSVDTLFTYIELFIENAPNRKDKTTGRLLTHNNIQQYSATFKHLKTFAKIKRKKDYRFEEIDNDFYKSFVQYLQKEIIAKDVNGEEKVVKKSFTQNTVGKQIRILKLMLNEATIEGYNSCSIYNSFHVFTEDTDTMYMNEIELQLLKDTNFSESPYLDRVRDWFLLLAWTGCRFSDLEKIGKTDIQDGYISFRQQKTNTKVTIPLHPVVLDVLEKYNYNLPEAISNQRFNEYIKEVVKNSGIDAMESITVTKGGKLVTETYPKWQLVSSHTGRRSFCTNMYKRGLPTLMIMSISGHKTEKSFLKYIKVQQSEHAEMMKNAWSKIYS